jgi:D-alanyl-D-alanine carboxypeptidase/D-alanyl-D-alanine-endopeptidase (penicillin-binding protein 4)
MAKTGTLGNPPVDVDPPEVKGLAGYLPTDSGQMMSFVLILNAPGVAIEDGYVPFWDALAPRLAAYPAGADRSILGPR